MVLNKIIRQQNNFKNKIKNKKIQYFIDCLSLMFMVAKVFLSSRGIEL